MSFLRCCFLLLAMSWACGAAELIAWKVPLEYYVKDGLKAEGAAKLLTPPEASVFFGTGDELWDLSKTDPGRKPRPKLDWLVWNATSRRLVGKGARAQTGAFHHQIETDHSSDRLRILFEVYRKTTGQPFAGEGKPALSYNLETSSVTRYHGRQESLDGTIEVGGQAWAFDKSYRAGMDLQLECTLKGQPGFQVDTFSVRVLSGVPVWIASDWDGKSGMDVRVTVTVEMADGTPRADQVLRDREGVVERANFWAQEIETMKAGEGQLRAMWASPSLFSELPALPRIVLPVILAEWIHKPVEDISDFLKKEGLVLGDEDFAGYDREGQMAYIHSSKPEQIEKFEVIFDAIIEPLPPLVMCTLDGPRRVSLLGISGRRLGLQRLEGGKIINSLEFEPVVNGLENLIDLRLKHEVASDLSKGAFDTSVTLENGKFKAISGTPEASGSRLKVDVLKEDP